ncbi:SNF2 family N-terminal domain-containing protein [Roridomyces roridus]|uniref:SNF2 family N-terminal domain-containing protein n=1 Tax=Roridomyces roridus TaxID=1738132 RepID=A0AAD7B209_9AGAR|nr:SNF2 family N-terminal domain-containing protein [Roridomyces roridus]
MNTPRRGPRASLGSSQSGTPSKPVYVEIDDLDSETDDHTTTEHLSPTKTPIRGATRASLVATPQRRAPSNLYISSPRFRARTASGSRTSPSAPSPDLEAAKNEDPEYTSPEIAALLENRPYIPPLRYETLYDNIQRRKDATDEEPPADPSELDVFLTCTRERFDKDLTVAEARVKLGMTPDSSVLPGVLIPLLDHQITGVAACVQRERSQYKGGIVADEMGLGKSRIRPDCSNCKTTLLVVPLALLSHWQRELEKVGGPEPQGIKYLIYHGPTKPKDYRTLKQYDVVLTTYGTISSQAELPNCASVSRARKYSIDLFEAPLFHTNMNFFRIVLDEGHFIRNPDGKASKHVARLTAKYRWVLTGTPIINRLFDVYPALRFLQVPYWQNRKSFKDEIARYESKNRRHAAVKAVAMLQAILDAIMLRRLKTTLVDGMPILDLPTKTVLVERLEFSENERRIYDLLESRARDGFKRLLRRGALTGNKLPVALTLLLRLRQACSHPALVKKFLDTLNHEELEARMDAFLAGNQEEALREIESGQVVVGEAADEEEGDEDSTWLQFMMQYIVKLRNEDPTAKIIVISQWTQFLALVADYLTQSKITYLCYQGSMTRKERDYAEREFSKDKGTAPVLLLSLQCGGAGLNLTRANHVICLDLGWSHAVENQAFDRVHRYGQTRPVFIQRVIIADTVEERILNIQDRKKSLADGSLGEGNGKSINTFGPKELAILFGLASYSQLSFTARERTSRGSAEDSRTRIYCPTAVTNASGPDAPVVQPDVETLEECVEEKNLGFNRVVVVPAFVEDERHGIFIYRGGSGACTLRTARKEHFRAVGGEKRHSCLLEREIGDGKFGRRSLGHYSHVDLVVTLSAVHRFRNFRAIWTKKWSAMIWGRRRNRQSRLRKRAGRLPQIPVSWSEANPDQTKQRAMTATSNLPQPYQYLLLHVSPPADQLTLRKALQESLSQSFGLTASGTHIDVLWVGVDPKTTTAKGTAAIRVASGEDTTRILASIVSSSSSTRLQLIRASAFLPSLLVDDDQ